MTVFIDILIIENFIVNYFLIYITSQALKLRLSNSNIIFASLIGSFYVLVLFSLKLQFFAALPFKFFIAFIMIVVSFRKIDMFSKIKAYGIFILFSMMLAGLCFFLALYKYNYENYATFILSRYPITKMIIAIMIIYLLLSRLLYYLKDRQAVSKLIYVVDIYFGNGYKSIKAFLDTGNELREPVTNLPVMLVQQEIFNNMGMEKIDKLYIPYKVINGTNSRIQGFKPNYIDIHIGKETKRREVIIGFCNTKLSSCGDYVALLSREII